MKNREQMRRLDPSGPAGRKSGYHVDTLKRKALAGEIDYFITPSGRWFFDIDGYLVRISGEAKKQKAG
jgi:hypothetical protein